MISLIIAAMGWPQYAALGDLIYTGIALLLFGSLFVHQLKMVKRGLMVDKLKGNEVINPFIEHPLAYRVILLLLCAFLAWLWPLYGVIKFFQYLDKNSTKTS